MYANTWQPDRHGGPAMLDLIEQNLEAIRSLCHEYQVMRLDVDRLDHDHRDDGQWRREDDAKWAEQHTKRDNRTERIRRGDCGGLADVTGPLECRVVYFYSGLRTAAHVDDKDDQLGAFDVAADEHMSFGVDLHLRGEPPADAYPHDEASDSSDDPLYPRLGELAYVSGFEATTSLDDESD